MSMIKPCNSADVTGFDTDLSEFPADLNYSKARFEKRINVFVLKYAEMINASCIS